MSFGLLPSRWEASAPLPELAAKLELRVQDIVASTRRLWVRGRLEGLLPLPEAPKTSWWWGWSAKGGQPLAHLETQVGGQVLQADVAVGPRGDFEAIFPVQLPATRRGWRVARNRVDYNGQTAESCGVVLPPPPHLQGVALVLLPRADTLEAGGAHQLERSEIARRQAPLLQELTREPPGHSLYYLACVPTSGEGHQAELSLAATALGWPTGHFILLPTDKGQADAAVASAIDRLRWLFAGHSAVVLSLDPAAQGLEAACTAVDERADVQLRCSNSGEGNHQDSGLKLRRLRSGLVTHYPLVFCHGMLACSMLRMQLPKEYNYFQVLREFLRERGFRCLFPMVTPTGGVQERSRQLAEQVRSWTDEPVNMIAHSMGGLDARCAISQLGLASQVRSLTTVGTPHRGTCLADWFLANYRQRVPLLLALEAVGVSVEGFSDCRPSVCREFNATTPDSPLVRYFSYAGEVPQAKVAPMLRRSWNLLTPIEGPNDGLVSIASARWGEYLGAVHADHFAQTPDGLFVRQDEDFDSLGFFVRLVQDLARRGF